MDRIAASARPAQPLRSKTGGSTFKNPPGTRHGNWSMRPGAGAEMGGAQVSEKHTNFLLNLGDATSAEIEALGEEVRRRVKDKSGVELQWEIQRVGVAGPEAHPRKREGRNEPLPWHVAVLMGGWSASGPSR
jgi:UDP-N-acetylmuramate dehydrogenase